MQAIRATEISKFSKGLDSIHHLGSFQFQPVRKLDAVLLQQRSKRKSQSLKLEVYFSNESRILAFYKTKAD